MTLADLLPHIARTHRLRLYSDEYAFAISPEDRARLKIMSPIVDLSVPVHSLGVRELQLQKRVYADTVRAGRSVQGPSDPLPITSGTANATNAGTSTAPLGIAALGITSSDNNNNNNNNNNKKVVPPTSAPKPSADAQTVVLTETVASMYQEWNVVKKNKFGMKQERIFGVDATRVYNAKRDRDKQKGQGPGVHRPHRELSAVRKVDVLSGDRKTFRITWQDGREVYDIDYTCENVRACNEIVAKLLFLTSGMKKGAK
jgi:SAPK-interacting protein 1 (Sin1), Pleckstrin-homology